MVVLLHWVCVDLTAHVSGVFTPYDNCTCHSLLLFSKHLTDVTLNYFSFSQQPTKLLSFVHAFFQDCLFAFLIREIWIISCHLFKRCLYKIRHWCDPFAKVEWEGIWKTKKFLLICEAKTAKPQKEKKYRDYWPCWNACHLLTGNGFHFDTPRNGYPKTYPPGDASLFPWC